jgi:hypothetical protein
VAQVRLEAGERFHVLRLIFAEPERRLVPSGSIAFD